MTANTTYWCDRRLVITVEGPGGRRVIKVDRPFARVGSHQSSEVVLSDETIAPRRLYFHATPTGIFCVDLAGIESGTPPLDGWIHADEYFMAGPYRISAQLAGKAAPPVPRLPDLNAKGTVPRPAPMLAMSVNGENIARRELTRQLTVFGRRRPSTLRVTSRSVSASHCVFYWESDVLWVVDLLSGNGTRLDGHLIEVGRLSPGETIRAGRVDFSLLAPSEVDRDDDGVRKTTYDDRPGSKRIRTDNDDSLDAKYLPTDRGGHEFPREIAESFALATRLASQREDLETEKAAWDDRRQKTEAELTARQAKFERQKESWESERRRKADESTSRIASQSEDLETEKAAWDERRKTEAELADREAEFERQKEDWESEQQQKADESASRLASQSEDLETEKAAWDDSRQKTEAELADREAEFERQKEDWESERQQKADELASRLASQSEELETEKAAWDDSRRKTEAELAARQAEFERQKESWEAERRREADESTSQLASQSEELETEKAAWDDSRQKTEAELAARQAEFERRKESWESERRRKADESATSEIAPAASDLDEPPNDLARFENEPRAESTTLERQATQQTIRLGPRWSPPVRPADTSVEQPRHATLGYWTAIVMLASILSASIGAACWYALLPDQTVVAAVQTTAEPTPPFDPSGFLDEDGNELCLVTPQEVLQDPGVWLAALVRPDVRSLSTIESPSEALDWLRKELVVESPDADGPTRISLRGKNVEELKILLDAIAEQCVSEVADSQRTDLEDWYKVLEAARNRCERDIADKEAALDQLTEKVPSGSAESLPEKRQANLNQLAEAQDKLTRFRAQRKMARIELARDRAVLDGDEKVDVSSTELDSLLRIDPVAGPLRAELAELIRARSETAATATGSIAGQSEEEYRQKIEATAQKLVARRDEIHKELLAKRQGRTEAEDVEDRDKIEDWPTREHQLQEEIDQRAQEARRLRQIETLQTALARLRESLAAATKEQESIQARLASRAAVCVIQHAAVAEEADKTYRLPITVAAAACGFLVPLLYAGAWSSRRRRAQSVSRLLKAYA